MYDVYAVAVYTKSSDDVLLFIIINFTMHNIYVVLNMFTQFRF